MDSNKESEEEEKIEEDDDDDDEEEDDEDEDDDDDGMDSNKESEIEKAEDDKKGEEDDDEGDEGRSNEAVDRQWASSLQQKLLDEPQSVKKSSVINGSCSSHRVPCCFRQKGDDSYVPQIISIGPFHRNNRSLQSMEEHKRKYLHDIVSHAPKLDSSVSL